MNSNTDTHSELPLGNDPDFGDDAPEGDHDDADESQSNEIISRYEKES